MGTWYTTGTSRATQGTSSRNAGPFPVTKARFNMVEVKMTPRMGRTATVSQQDCGPWPEEACEPQVYETINEIDQIIEDEDAPETMKEVKAKDLGYYEVD